MRYHLILVSLPDQVELVELVLPCLIPYEVCHALYNKGPDMFRTSMLGESGEAGVVDFWHHAMQEHWAKEHPVVQQFWDTPDVMIPWTWHIDGGEMQRNSEFYIVNFGSVLAQASEAHCLDARFLVAGVPHVLMRLPDVKKKIMQYVHESCLGGVRPLRVRRRACS